MGISKYSKNEQHILYYSKNAIRKYQTLFDFIVSHHMQWNKPGNTVKKIFFNKTAFTVTYSMT